MIKPIYDVDGITLYCGDCREILPQIGKVDLLLTDPPYGIGRSGQRATFCKNNKHSRKLHRDFYWDEARPCRAVFEEMFRVSQNQIIWGGNYFSEFLPPSMGWIAWDKGQDFSTSDFELAFTSFRKAARRVVVNRGAIAREGAMHPTQKPLAVIRFCMRYAGEFSCVLDPFAGSGTTLVAAKLEGRRAIGIEISHKYCESAMNRLKQGVLFGADHAQL